MILLHGANYLSRTIQYAEDNVVIFEFPVGDSPENWVPEDLLPTRAVLTEKVFLEAPTRWEGELWELRDELKRIKQRIINAGGRKREIKIQVDTPRVDSGLSEELE